MKRDTIWQFEVVKYVVIGLLFFIPLIVSQNQVFMYTTTKSLLMIGGALSALGFYLWGRISERTSNFALSLGDMILVLFAAVLVLSSIYALVPHLSFFGNFAGMSALLVISGIVLAMLIAFLLRHQILSITALLGVSVVSSVLVVGTVWQGVLKTSSINDSGSIGNSSYAGAYLLVNLFFALVLLWSQKNKWSKIFSALAMVLIVTSPIFFNINIFKGSVSLSAIFSNPTLLGGEANGAIIGIVVGLVAMVGILFIRSPKKWLQWSGAVLIVVLFVALWSAGYALMKPNTRIHDIYVAQKEGNRFIFWDIAYAGMNDRPLLGWGINGYSYVFQKYFDPVLYTQGYVPELWTDNPHNMMAEYLVNTGILGLIVYLAVIGSSAVGLVVMSRSEDKTRRILGIVLFGALTGYVVQNFFIFDTVAPLMVFFVIIGISLSAKTIINWSIDKKKNGLKHAGGLIGIVGVVIMIYIGSILPWKESKNVFRQTRTHTIRTDNLPQKISYMGYAGDSAFFSGEFIDLLMLKPAKDLTDAQKEKIKQTINVLIREMDTDQTIDGVKNFRAQWMMGLYASRYADLDENQKKEKVQEAQGYLKNALAINPNNPLVYLDMAQTYVINKDYKGAIKWIRAAIALAPESNTVYQYADQFINQKIASPDFGQYVKFMSQKWCGVDRSKCLN